jgi:hypothetical protein
VTFATSMSFSNLGVQVYTLTGLGSTSPRIASSTFPSLNIGVTSGYILLAGGVTFGSELTLPWAGTPESPSSTHVDTGAQSPYSTVEDWTIISTNTSFTSSNLNGQFSAVTFF